MLRGRQSNISAQAPFFMLRLVWLLTILTVLSACATQSDEIYQGYLGPQRGDAEIATLRLGDADWARVDLIGPEHDDLYLNRNQYGAVNLLPGRYQIEWGHTFGFSVMVEPAMLLSFERRETVALSAGHTYTLHADRTYGHGYRVFFWITDDTTGATIAGSTKP